MIIQKEASKYQVIPKVMLLIFFMKASIDSYVKETNLKDDNNKFLN